MLSALVFSTFISQALAFTRTIGPPGDYRFIRASEACDGSNPKKFEFGEYSVLIACVYDNLDEAFKASMSSGTNIASLLPTILVLIGKLDFLPGPNGNPQSASCWVRLHKIKTVSILSESF